jgi:hypothetical protein
MNLEGSERKRLCSVLKVLSQSLSRGTEKNHENIVMPPHPLSKSGPPEHISRTVTTQLRIFVRPTRHRSPTSVLFRVVCNLHAKLSVGIASRLWGARLEFDSRQGQKIFLLFI